MKTSSHSSITGIVKYVCMSPLAWGYTSPSSHLCLWTVDFSTHIRANSTRKWGLYTLTTHLRYISMMYSCHFDESWVSEVTWLLVIMALMTLQHQSSTNSQQMLQPKLFLMNSFEIRSDPMLPRFSGEEQTSVLQDPNCNGKSVPCICHTDAFAYPCGEMSGSEKKDLFSSLPAQQRMHNTSCCYCISWKDGDWGGLGLCVYGSCEDFPQERWRSYPPCVIFPCSCNHFLSHEGVGGLQKKLTVKNSKEMEGEKQVEVQCNAQRMGVCVCVCVFSACAHMLISQIGDDDTQQAENNRNPQRWHLSACLSN